ncbi:hypothetical protein JW887_03015 [Candidatus Dojkabacteria bacterium]|nr:hypothetical protein [Candidatus Dojkabacteria bacterium]
MSKFLFVIPQFLVGIGFFIAIFFTDPEALTDDGFSLRWFFFIMGMSFTIFPIGLVMFLNYLEKKNLKRVQRFHEVGLSGNARLIGCERTGLTVNDQPQLEMTFEIDNSMFGKYTIKHKEIVDILDIGRLVRGIELPVLINPDNKEDILIEWDKDFEKPEK